MRPRYGSSASLIILLLAGSASGSTIQPSAASFLSPFKIRLSSEWGEITRFYIPPAQSTRKQPDFILIQDVHSNRYVQHAISNLLTQLDQQGLLSRTIAIEGAVGPVQFPTYQATLDTPGRKRLADHLITEGKISGAAHYVIVKGNGNLYGTESPELYKTSVDMFRRSFAARAHLNKELDKLEAALNLLKSESTIPVSVSLLCQDVRAMRHLINQQLVPEETHDAVKRALLAADHMRSIFPRKQAYLLQAVSAAVNFYALALLRDDALFVRSLDLRTREAQQSTVIIAGGFHTPGLAQRLIQNGYSYVVITPRVKEPTRAEERLYVARVLGHPMSSRAAEQSVDPTALPSLESSLNAQAQSNEIWVLAVKLQHRLPQIQFSKTPSMEIFNAMDAPWIQRSIRVSLNEQRSKIFAPALTALPDWNLHRIF